MVDWIQFSDQQRLRFFELVTRLNQERLSQLSGFEQTTFYHYWHKLFNEHHCWLLELAGNDVAFVSQPAWDAKHWIRWPENILLMAPELKRLNRFPDKLKDETVFRTGLNGTRNLENAELKLLQSAYVLNVQEFDQPLSHMVADEVEFQKLGSQKLPEIRELLSAENRKSDVEPGIYEEYYLPELVRMVEQNHQQSNGFGYLAIESITGDPIGIAFYEGFEMPLTGNRCLLVSDILVKKEWRQKGIATNLQRFAYGDMRANGVNWVMGNIDPANVSSLKQAQALGRTVWSDEIEIKFV